MHFNFIMKELSVHTGTSPSVLLQISINQEEVNLHLLSYYRLNTRWFLFIFAEVVVFSREPHYINRIAQMRRLSECCVPLRGFSMTCETIA